MAPVSTASPFYGPPDIVLYHADCFDGFGAAWAVWKKFPNARFSPSNTANLRLPISMTVGY